jgi:ATP-dependent helicase/nuclease subunit B
MSLDPNPSASPSPSPSRSPLPRSFNIPASAPFLSTLIAALVEGRLIPGFPAGRDPLALADATIYRPTRRACRLARDLFLDVTGERAAILPRIRPIGDIDEDEIAFAQAATPADAALAAPEAIGAIERRFLLMQLVLAWAKQIKPEREDETPLLAGSPAAALALADDLARLLDDMTTRQVPWERLDELVPDEHDAYWQLTLRFLTTIVREWWFPFLDERGVIEPAARRDALLKAEAARMTASGAPVIVAGSTGSTPATAALIATVAARPNGAVVLPGLDTDLDEASWEMIAGRRDADGRESVAPVTGHPQFALQALLRRIGIGRDEVAALAAPAPRARYASEALRPAAATERWRGLASGDFAQAVDRSLTDMTIIEAANAEEEALAVAVALREAVESEGKTSALVTPDRALARRVLAALARWNVAVDDSGGDALADTPAGRFALLAAKTALGGLEPVPLLALLKHSLLRLGAAENTYARGLAALELAVLRGPRPKAGTTGLQAALTTFRAELAKLRRREASNLHPSELRAALGDRDLQAADRLVVELTAALAPLEGLRTGSHPFAELVKHHRKAIELLSDDGAGTSVGLAGHDGAALLTALDELAASEDVAGFQVTLADYPDLFRAAVGDRPVRRPGAPGARVRIYGPLEARLQPVDRVVLGGLVEGVWPPRTRSDPWLSRPMRHQLGLDLPERRISLSAHDFAQALGAPEVVLSYAAKLDGAPTVTSRFVQRLAAVAGDRWNGVRQRGERYIGWARALDAPAEVRRVKKPAPKPPRAARPTALSVTEIENWLRDPYTIYARHILNLRELDAVDLPPGAADRGILIHGALGEFTKTYAGALPADPEGVLAGIAQKHFAALQDYPEARAFWWPRFVRIARWFAGWELERRPDIAALLAESYGTITISLGERSFSLRARADRIERLADGRYAILDYKTGSAPTDKQVRVGISPQLTLEAAILRRGGFPDIPSGGSVADLIYVELKGGVPAGNPRPVQFKDSTPDAQADLALAKLTTLAMRFEDEAQAYHPLVLSMWKNRYGAYDHLARVKEWSVGGDDTEDETGGAE